MYYSTECYDELGNLVKTDATYVDTTHTYTLTTKKSLFCYIKFVKLTSSTAINTIMANAGTQLETPENMKERGDNLRRFQGPAEGEGAVLNNYICLGTSNKTTCTGGPNTYMYRIIGVVSEINNPNTTNEIVNQLKVMKKNAGTYMSDLRWHGFSSGSEYTWGYPCSLNSSINGNAFLTHSYYRLSDNVGNTNKTWQNDVIAPHTYQYADLPESSTTGSQGTAAMEIFALEKSMWSTGENKGISNNKIGLMYASDYALAGSNYARCDTSQGSIYKDEVCEKSWMNAKNDRDSSIGEPTMSKLGDKIWMVHSWSFLTTSSMGNVVYPRPVFYIQSTIQITGTGTITDPYIITNV